MRLREAAGALLVQDHTLGGKLLRSERQEVKMWGPDRTRIASATVWRTGCRAQGWIWKGTRCCGFQTGAWRRLGIQATHRAIPLMWTRRNVACKRARGLPYDLGVLTHCGKSEPGEKWRKWKPGTKKWEKEGRHRSWIPAPSYPTTPQGRYHLSPVGKLRPRRLRCLTLVTEPPSDRVKWNSAQICASPVTFEFGASVPSWILSMRTCGNTGLVQFLPFPYRGVQGGAQALAWGWRYWDHARNKPISPLWRSRFPLLMKVFQKPSWSAGYN